MLAVSLVSKVEVAFGCRGILSLIDQRGSHARSLQHPRRPATREAAVYNQITNYPYLRAFATQPLSSGVEFSNEEVDRIVAQFANEPLRRGDLDEGRVDESLRIANLNFYYPTEETFWIFEKLNYIIQLNNEQFWNFDLNGYASFQYTEYEAAEGGKYDFHADMDYSQRDGAADPQTRKLSLSLILNEPGVDFEGGEFQILLGREPITCDQAKGSVLLFPSWVLHRVTPVTRGVRKSIVVWVTGPKFR
jgi:PKHD-type hydroxylase